MENRRFVVAKVKWFFLFVFILGGSVYSVFTQTEWPPFSPYPMYSWPIAEKNLVIYRVIVPDNADPELQKKIIGINTIRTVTTLMTSRWTRRYPTMAMAEDLLDYYQQKLKSQLPVERQPAKLRLERVSYLYSDLRIQIDQVARARNWIEMDQVVPASIEIVHER